MTGHRPAAVALAVLLLTGCTSTVAGTGSSGAGSVPGLGAGHVAIVRDGPAELRSQPLPGAAGRPVQVPGSPDRIVSTADGKKAYLLDTDHAAVVPVDLTKGTAGKPIPAGKLPVDMLLSSDGDELVVVDNLNGDLVRIDVSSDEVVGTLDAGGGPAMFDLSPDGRQAVVTRYSGPGDPGSLTYIDPADDEYELSVGKNFPSDVTFGADGRTLWVTQPGIGASVGTVTPVDLSSRRAGTPIPLGREPVAAAMTADGRRLLIPNERDGTVSVVDLTARRVTGTLRTCESPVAVKTTPDKRSAWVLCSLARAMQRIDLASLQAREVVRLPNTPSDFVLGGGDGRAATVLYPSSDGSVAFVESDGRLGKPITVGNAPRMVIPADNSAAWVINSLSDTVQKIDRTAGQATRATRVPDAPVQLMLLDGNRSLLVLSAGDGRTPGHVTLLDTATARARTPIPVGTSPAALLASRDRRRVAVLSPQQKRITELDVVAWQAGRSVTLPCAPTDAVMSPDGATIYAACDETRQLFAIPIATYAPESPVPIIGVRQLAVAPDGGHVYVLGFDELQSVDTADNRAGLPAPLSGNLFRIAPTQDGRYLVGLDNTANQLTVLDPTRLRPVRTVNLEGRPDEVVLSADSATAYVLDGTRQQLSVVGVESGKVLTGVDVAPNASAVVVPDR